MKRRFRDYILVICLLMPVMAYGATAPAPAAPAAGSPQESACQGLGGTFTNGTCSAGGTQTVNGVFKEVANILIFLIGAISVLMVIIGGLRYVLSGGDSSGIKSAKDTILYALVGIVVAFAAYAIVNFVINNLK